jgi:hypothetical protein
MAVAADSPTRSRVVANNIPFLQREYRANQERWLINVDRNHRGDDQNNMIHDKLSSSNNNKKTPHNYHP